VIPSYNRSQELLYSLKILQKQILSLASQIEVIVCDDASTDETETLLSKLESETNFLKYIRYSSNIGLERNLIDCTNHATGEYLWIFGDDDFLATEDTLQTVVTELESGKYDLLVLNRSRQSFALDKVLSDDWMGIENQPNKTYLGLRDFFLEWGFISVIGFISVNIMRRVPFLESYDERYFGTMYPQLGMMADAFSDSSVLLISRALICHRTQTAEEKAQAFVGKDQEKTFMSDVERRDASYFGAPYIRMISILVDNGSITWEELNKVSENTVINGRLIDFLFNNIVKAVNFGIEISIDERRAINKFFSNVELTGEQIHRLSRYSFMNDKKFLPAEKIASKVSISVITPSYNQAKFFPECLDSVFDQTVWPVEHIVLDPGSTDGSRNIARYYRHVTLIDEPDDGQGDAVGKGIQLAKGDVIAWLNSDDSYYDNQVLETISTLFEEGDDQVIYGDGVFFDGDGNKIRDVYVNKNSSTLPWRFQQEDGIFQPALFFKKSVPDSIGLPSQYLEFCMDYEYWIRAVKHGIKFRYVPKKFAKAYFHTDNKTLGQRGKSYAQVCSMLFDQFGYVNHIWLQRYAEFLSDGFDGVIEHSGNTQLEQSDNYNIIYKNLLEQFNTNAVTLEKLDANASIKGYGDTYRELKERKLIPSHYIQIDNLEQNAVSRANYAMGDKIWSFDRAWKNAQIKKSHTFLRQMIDRRKSDICIIVCNGPSLNLIDKQLLSKADVIGCNGIFLDEEVARHIDFFTCVNYLVAEQYAPQINELEAFKILPWWLAYCINGSSNTNFVDAKGFPEFSTNMFENMSWRHTVTFFNLHLAYGLGYKKVLMVGCDHSYIQSDTAAEQDIIFEDQDDVNHFDPRYFKSKRWQAADTGQMEEMYKLAKEAYTADDREIINCTVGGNLELFRRSSLEDQVGGYRTHKMSNIGRAPLIGPFERNVKAHIDETHIIAQYLADQPPGYMIDVGAHHGWALQPFLDMGWNILAFEPDPKNRSILESRVGDRQEVEIVAMACSDSAGDIVPFYASEESTGISGLSSFRDSHEIVCEVETTTLLNELAARGVGKIDFLKIDTEGFDLMVLKGFPWKDHSPEVIECEFENAKTRPLGYTFEDIANFLFEKDYTVYVSEWHPVVRYGIQHDWKSLTLYSGERTPEDCWGNLLAFKNLPKESALIEAARAASPALEIHNVAKAKSKKDTIPPAGKEPTITTVNVRTYPFFDSFAVRMSRILVKYPKIYGVFARPWRWYLKTMHGHK